MFTYTHIHTLTEIHLLIHTLIPTHIIYIHTYAHIHTCTHTPFTLILIHTDAFTPGIFFASSLETFSFGFLCTEGFTEIMTL